MADFAKAQLLKYGWKEGTLWYKFSVNFSNFRIKQHNLVC